MIVLSYGELSIRERLYVTLAWVPKAGVQVRSLPTPRTVVSVWHLRVGA